MAKNFTHKHLHSTQSDSGFNACPPEPSNLEIGEIAVNAFSGDPRLYIIDTEGRVRSFCTSDNLRKEIGVVRPFIEAPGLMSVEDKVKLDGIANTENTANKVDDVYSNKDDVIKYTTAGAVYAARKELLIDLWNARGIDRFAPAGQQKYATYNRITGFFEINGLTDVTYEQALEIYSLTADGIESSILTRKFEGSGLRTTFRRRYHHTHGAVYQRDTFANCTQLELFVSLSEGIYIGFTAGGFGGIFRNCAKLKTVRTIYHFGSVTSNDGAFDGCVALEDCYIFGLQNSISFSSSPMLNVNSVEYIIRRATTAAGIVITLHPTAYARAIADPAVQAALAAKPNVTLAQA